MIEMSCSWTCFTLDGCWVRNQTIMKKSKFAVLLRCTSRQQEQLRGKSVWTNGRLRKGPPPIQKLPSHILYCLSTYFGKENLFQKATYAPAQQWSENVRARLDMYKVASLLVVEFGSAHNVLKIPAALHKSAGQKLFTECPIQAREVATYFYGSLVHSKPLEKKLKKTYGEYLIAVTVEKLSKWAFKIVDTVVNEKVVNQATWIVPALFFGCGTSMMLCIDWKIKLQIKWRDRITDSITYHCYWCWVQETCPNWGYSVA